MGFETGVEYRFVEVTIGSYIAESDIKLNEYTVDGWELHSWNFKPGTEIAVVLLYRFPDTG